VNLDRSRAGWPGSPRRRRRRSPGSTRLPGSSEERLGLPGLRPRRRRALASPVGSSQNVFDLFGADKVHPRNSPRIPFSDRILYIRRRPYYDVTGSGRQEKGAGAIVPPIIGLSPKPNRLCLPAVPNHNLWCPKSSTAPDGTITRRESCFARRSHDRVHSYLLAWKNIGFASWCRTTTACTALRQVVTTSPKAEETRKKHGTECRLRGFCACFLWGTRVQYAYSMDGGTTGWWQEQHGGNQSS